MNIKKILKFTGMYRTDTIKTQKDVIEDFAHAIGKKNALQLVNNQKNIEDLLDAVLVGMALSRKEMTAEELYRQSLNIIKGINKFIK